MSLATATDMSTIPHLGRVHAMGAEYRVRGGAIVARLAPVRGRLLPVLPGAGLIADVGEEFVQPCRPVMGAGRVQSHHRRPPGRLKSALAGQPRKSLRLRRLRRLFRRWACAPPLIAGGTHAC